MVRFKFRITHRIFRLGMPRQLLNSTQIGMSNARLVSTLLAGSYAGSRPISVAQTGMMIGCIITASNVPNFTLDWIACAPIPDISILANIRVIHDHDFGSAVYAVQNDQQPDGSNEHEVRAE